MNIMNNWVESFYWWRMHMTYDSLDADKKYSKENFWSCLNEGWDGMNYKWEFEKFWGKGAEPERIVLSQRDYDALVERLNAPPQYNDRLAEILKRVPPWERTDD